MTATDSETPPPLDLASVPVWKRIVAPIVVGLLALGVFVATLAPTVTAEDSGELIAAAWQFGIPHPPGYPLWTILCGIFTHLIPLGSIAWRANLFSATCSAAAAVLIFAAIRELKLSRSVAGAAALVWVWSRWSWTQSVITEVYGLNSLLTAGVLWCGLRWYRTKGHKPLCIASLLMGLGMCNHHTIALAGLPLVIWILLQQPGLMKRYRLALGCIGLFVVGLLPYLYLPVRAAAHPPVNWGNPSTAERFWEHVTRHQYGAVGPMKVAEPRSPGRLVGQLGYLASSVEDDLTTWMFGVAILGGVYMAWKQRRELLLVLLWVAGTGVLFVVLANYDLDRTSRWAMRVFLIPVSMGLTIPIAYLLEWSIGKTRRALSSSRWLTIPATIVLVAAGPMLQLATQWHKCDYSRYWYAYDHARNLLSCMLPNALVFPSGDHSSFPLVYVTMIEGERPDVVIGDIYGYIRPELCTEQPKDSPDSPETWLIKHARRPVYYVTKKRPPVDHARFVSAGILYHLLPAGMEYDNSGLLESCAYRNPQQPTVLDFGGSHIMTDYEFFSGLHALEHGQAEQALAHFERAGDYGEGIKEVFNNIGSALAEHGLTEPAIGYFERAAKLNWRYALPRWNLFRTFKSQGRWHDAHAQLRQLIRATPDDYRVHGELGFLLAHRLNDPQAAKWAWQESLRLNPDQPQIIEALHEHQQPVPPDDASL